MSTRTSKPIRTSGAETLEIFVFDCVQVNLRIIPDAPLRAPQAFPMPSFEPGFARVLEPLRAIFATTRPPTPMGAFVMNPKPALL